MMPGAKQLEAIVHPRIHERWQAAVAQWRKEGRSAGGMVIPLLFESARRLIST